MIKRGLQSIAATWLAGLLVLLPLALTMAVLAWGFTLVSSLLGPSSLAGHIFAALGYPFATNPGLAYLIGTLLLLTGIWLLGLVLRLGLYNPLRALTDRTLRRIPIVGGVYNVADRFVGLLDQQKSADIGAMSPVWCFFGGSGAAVLALSPSSDTIDIDGRPYRTVLIPTAPVPIGGALMYVPAEWVRPARIGADKLTAVYVSMGITQPPPPG
jgi:uncharacterized membrane protein